MASDEKVGMTMNLSTGPFLVIRHPNVEIITSFSRLSASNTSVSPPEMRFLSLFAEFLRWWKQKYRGKVNKRSDEDENRIRDEVNRIQDWPDNDANRVQEWSDEEIKIFAQLLSFEVQDVNESDRVQDEDETMRSLSVEVQDVNEALRHPSSSTIEAVLGRTARSIQPRKADQRPCPKPLSEIRHEDLRTQSEEFPWHVCLTSSIVRRFINPKRVFSCVLPPTPLSKVEARRMNVNDRCSKLHLPHQANYTSDELSEILELQQVGDMTSSFCVLIIGRTSRIGDITSSFCRVGDMTSSFCVSIIGRTSQICSIEGDVYELIQVASVQDFDLSLGCKDVSASVSGFELCKHLCSSVGDRVCIGTA
jgi:hypothetical protein